MSVFEIVCIVAAVVVALAWIWPLTVGILRIRRKAGGYGLTLLGGVWGVFAIGALSIAAAGWFVANRIGGAGVRVIEFDPATHTGATATITLPWQGATAITLYESGDKNRQFLCAGSNGAVVVPAGTFGYWHCVLSCTDSNGSLWNVSTWGDSAQVLSLPPGGTFDLKAGPPFTASIKASTKGAEEVSLDFALVGTDGRKYAIRNTDESGGAPEFQALDGAGKQVAGGKFEFG